MFESKRAEPLWDARLTLCHLQRNLFPIQLSCFLPGGVCFLCTDPASAWLRRFTKCSAAESFQHFTGPLAFARLPLSKGCSPTQQLPSGQLCPRGHTSPELSLRPLAALIVFTPSIPSRIFWIVYQGFSPLPGQKCNIEQMENRKI